MKKFSVQIISDIHLEYTKKLPKFKYVSPNIALLGDIGNPRLNSYEKFLDVMSYSYDNIYLISGNHEYWNLDGCTKMTKDETDICINTIVSKYNNIHYLNNKSVIHNGIKIIGSTLWSYIDYRYANINIGDYHMISYDGNIDKRKNNELYNESKNFIESEINSINCDNIIVLTHHCPSYKFISNKFINNKHNFAYASNLDHLIKYPVKAWLSGHTHCYVSHNINGVQCCVNPYGYCQETTGFNYEKVIQIIR